MGMIGTTFDRVLIVRTWIGEHQIENVYKSYCYLQKNAAPLLDQVLITYRQATGSVPLRKKAL